MDTSLIKLTNGETVIANVAPSSKDEVILVDPMKVETISRHGRYYSALVFWIPLGEEPLRIPVKKEHVIAITDVTYEMSKEYVHFLTSLREPEPEESDPFDKIETVDELAALIGLTSGNTTIH